MAKRTRSTRGKPPAPAPEPVAPPLPEAEVVSPPRPARPRFWHDFEISWAKWTVFRFVFFALHAADAFLQLTHAPRYGAGGFNVPQVAGLPLPEPSRAGMTFVYGALCVLFALVAQGVAVRWILPVATALYGYAYFVSQLDSYQHHYLMWLLLVILCFVPVRPDPGPPGARVAWVRSWALRLVLVQLAIVYAWAAVAKLDPVWLDGSALHRMVSTPWIRSLFTTLGFGFVAAAVLLVEVTLAATVWSRRLWMIALPLGVGMHAGIELIGLDIGLFSYFMIATYLLVVPDVVFPPLVAGLGRLGAPLGRIPDRVRIPAGMIAIAASLAVVFRHPLPLVAVGIVAVIAGVAIIAAGAGPMPRRVRTVALAVLPLAILLTVTQVANRHFRNWAGASRRMALAADERAAYQGLLAVDATSEYAHYYLGQLELRAGKADAALAHFRAAQASEPRRARAYLAEVAAHVAAGDRAAARAVLDRGLALDPGNAELTARRAALEADGGR